MSDREQLAHTSFDLAVIIPTLGDIERLHYSLESLARQRPSGLRVQIIIGLNGLSRFNHPEDRMDFVDSIKELIDQVLGSQPHFAAQILEIDAPSVAQARNDALSVVNAPWVFYLDDDDIAGKSLFRRIERDMKQLPSDVDFLHIPAFAFGPAIKPRDLVKWPLLWFKIPVGVSAASDCPWIWGLHCAKIARTSALEGVSFEPSLESGEDVLFWVEVVSRGAGPRAFRCYKSSHRPTGAYWRNFLRSSRSRGHLGPEYYIRQRQQLITLLSELPQNAVRDSRIAAQEGIMSRFLLEQR